ncbi:hypothetical protein [Candidatus Poriferisodalis sp.]|uniref:hypothetical protein n=1 Tax=Candidatus Poriferisodalis sp. TaxID=3101277 RepID=UPI003B018CA5
MQVTPGDGTLTVSMSCLGAADGDSRPKTLTAFFEPGTAATADLAEPPTRL